MAFARHGCAGHTLAHAVRPYRGANHFLDKHGLIQNFAPGLKSRYNLFMDVYAAERGQMVLEQIERRGVRDARLLEAMRSIPRHRFVPPEEQAYAYDDAPLPIGFQQTISQPYIVALMTEMLALQGDECVLEVGAGSGYQAAILSRLARVVHTVELQPQLAQRSAALLAELGCTNVSVHCADGSLGWPEAAPYQAVIVTAAAPAVPPPLVEQLAVGGRIVLPVGERWSQRLYLGRKTETGLQLESTLPVSFVPLHGRYGI